MKVKKPTTAAPKAPHTILSRFLRSEELGRQLGALNREKKSIKEELIELFGRKKAFSFSEVDPDSGQRRLYLLKRNHVERAEYVMPACSYEQFDREEVKESK